MNSSVTLLLGALSWMAPCIRAVDRDLTEINETGMLLIPSTILTTMK